MGAAQELRCLEQDDKAWMAFLLQLRGLALLIKVRLTSVQVLEILPSANWQYLGVKVGWVNTN